jgi:hypothetical protein
VVEVEREGGGKHRGESSLLICIHFLHREGWMCTDFLWEHYWIFNSQKGLEDLVVEEQRGKFVRTKVRHLHLRFLGLCVSRGSG